MVVKDGEINEQDEDHIKNCLRAQQDIWNVLLIVDTLVLSMLLPIIVENVHARGIDDVKVLDDNTTRELEWAFVVTSGFTFFFAFLHLVFTSTLYTLTAYLLDPRDILWFFVTYKSAIAFLMASALLAGIPLMVIACLGCSLAFGRVALPVVGMMVLTLAGCLCWYKVVIVGPFVRRMRTTHFDAAPPPANPISLHRSASSKASGAPDAPIASSKACGAPAGAPVASSKACGAPTDAPPVSPTARGALAKKAAATVEEFCAFLEAAHLTSLAQLLLDGGIESEADLRTTGLAALKAYLDDIGQPLKHFEAVKLRNLLECDGKKGQRRRRSAQPSDSGHSDSGEPKSPSSTSRILTISEREFRV